MKKQTSAFTNENEKIMDLIATEMAVYFDKRITASNLTKWVAIAGDYCKNFPPNKEVRFDPVSLLHSIGWGVLPQLIDCKTSDDRITALKESLPWLFGCEGYQDTKIALSEIGIIFLKAFVKLSSDDEGISEFMETYTALLCAIEMYSEFEYHEKEMRKAA